MTFEIYEDYFNFLIDNFRLLGLGKFSAEINRDGFKNKFAKTKITGCLHQQGILFKYANIK